MNPEENDLLRKYIDGELSENEEQQALRRIADDPEQRSLLRIELQMQQAMRSGFDHSSSSFRVPEGFSDEVMAGITAVEKTASRASNPLFNRLSKLFEPRQITVQPARVTAGLAVLLIIFLTLPLAYGPVWEDEEATPVRGVAEEQQDQLWMRFVYVSDDAETVEVAGDFSDWDRIPLTKNSVNGEVVWTGLVPMSQGEYRYMFVKDDEEWVTDPLADSYRDDGFGNKNAVIKL